MLATDYPTSSLRLAICLQVMLIPLCFQALRNPKLVSRQGRGYRKVKTTPRTHETCKRKWTVRSQYLAKQYTRACLETRPERTGQLGFMRFRLEILPFPEIFLAMKSSSWMTMIGRTWTQRRRRKSDAASSPRLTTTILKRSK